jgi:FkbM family methyltransferase
MNIINEVLTRLARCPHKAGLSYLLEAEGRRIESIKSIAIIGSFSDKISAKYEYYLKKNNVNYKFYKDIDIDFKTGWSKFDCILIGSITRYAHYKKALIEIGVPIKLIAQPEEFCQLRSNFFSEDNTLPYWPNDEKSIEDRINWLRENDQLLLEAYSLIEPCSREIYIDKIATYIRPDCINIFIEFIRKHSSPYHIFGPIPLNGDTPPFGIENFFYFFNDLIKIKNNCVYVDIGAHNGDSLSSFLRRCAVNGFNHSKIFCFEPDQFSYAELIRNWSSVKNISFFNTAISDENSTIGYNSFGTGGGNMNRNSINENDYFVNCGHLSQFISDSKVDIIKWDTPGLNVTMKVLAGCETSIISKKPKLIIGAYHNVNDIFQIPIKIKKLANDYKIFLRHNSWLHTETSYYCIN